MRTTLPDVIRDYVEASNGRDEERFGTLCLGIGLLNPAAFSRRNLENGVFNDTVFLEHSRSGQFDSPTLGQ